MIGGTTLIAIKHILCISKLIQQLATQFEQIQYSQFVIFNSFSLNADPEHNPYIPKMKVETHHEDGKFYGHP